MRLVVNDISFIKSKEFYTYQIINYSLKIDIFKKMSQFSVKKTAIGAIEM